MAFFRFGAYMNLFLQQEITTLIQPGDNEISIIQYSDDSAEIETGRISLTRRQFDEIVNQAKQLFDGEK